MKKLKNKNNKGFTLVELIVVIAVLAIITVVVSPQLIEYVEKSRIGTDRNTVGEVAHAAEVVYVKHDKKAEVNFPVRINSKGIANYGGDGIIGDEFVADVAEIVPPEVYTYKSKTYRDHTILIKVGEDGVATVDEGLIKNETLADKIEDLLGIPADLIEDALQDIVNGIGGILGVEDLAEKLDEFIYDIETDIGAFDDLKHAEKEEQLNNKGQQIGIPDLGTRLGDAGLLKGCTCRKCPSQCNCEGCPDNNGKNGNCVASGSEITLANGTVKKVEDLLPTDKLLAFDHESGEYVAADILAVVFHGNDFYHVMNLGFANGETVKLIGHHALFDVTANQYVFVTDDNFMDYIGHEFAMQSEGGYETSTLEYAFLSYEYTGSYAVLTDYYMNCFTDGFFSNIYAAKVVANAFEYDSDLKYDAEKMQQDIETYGLYTYEDFAPYVSEEAYDLLPFPYIKVCEGKGIISQEEVLDILGEYTYYLNLFEDEANYIEH